MLCFYTTILFLTLLSSFCKQSSSVHIDRMSVTLTSHHVFRKLESDWSAMRPTPCIVTDQGNQSGSSFEQRQEFYGSSGKGLYILLSLVIFAADFARFPCHGNSLVVVVIILFYIMETHCNHLILLLQQKRIYTEISL